MLKKSKHVKLNILIDEFGALFDETEKQSMDIAISTLLT